MKNPAPPLPRNTQETTYASNVFESDSAKSAHPTVNNDNETNRTHFTPFKSITLPQNIIESGTETVPAVNIALNFSFCPTHSSSPSPSGIIIVAPSSAPRKHVSANWPSRFNEIVNALKPNVTPVHKRHSTTERHRRNHFWRPFVFVVGVVVFALGKAADLVVVFVVIFLLLLLLLCFCFCVVVVFFASAENTPLVYRHST
mmetsp:Transcript_8362/g.24617  ORF Transcript_8362/g.24617 Transcript_8362/m.24617 type:complete len:201 (+) Transcript_8362:1074-1676(+)